MWYLEKNTGWLEWDFNLLWCAVLPIQDLLNILTSDLEVIAVSDCRFKENPYGVGEPIWQKNRPDTWVESSEFSDN